MLFDLNNVSDEQVENIYRLSKDVFESELASIDNQLKLAANSPFPMFTAPLSAPLFEVKDRIEAELAALEEWYQQRKSNG